MTPEQIEIAAALIKQTRLQEFEMPSPKIPAVFIAMIWFLASTHGE